MLEHPAGPEEETVPRAPVLVLGIGNELARDDGVGVIAARVLQQERLPDGVEVVEGGAGGFDLVFELEGRRRAIIIDAADMGAPPGTVRGFALDDVETELVTLHASLHQVGLPDVLEIARLVGPLPDVWIIGVQPKEVLPGFGLSPEVGRAIPEIVRKVREALADAGRDSSLPTA